MKPVLDARFWSRVSKSPSCWLWTGLKQTNGYGRMRYQGRESSVHRLLYASIHGWPALNLDVCHRCDVKTCVRPEHLFVGTRSDNIRDCVSKGRHRSMWPHGEQANTAKLTWDKVRAIRASGEPRRVLASRYGVSVSNIRNILIGTVWKESRATPAKGGDHG